MARAIKTENNMIAPIPITFSRELPIGTGYWLWRQAQGYVVRCRLIKRGAKYLYDNEVGMGVSVKDIGGEWSGPLQLISASPTEAGD